MACGIFEDNISAAALEVDALGLSATENCTWILIRPGLRFYVIVYLCVGIAD